MRSTVPLWEKPVLRQAAGETLRPGGFRLTDRAAEVMGLVPGCRVLDVGSGLGATVGRLRSRFGVEAYGVESSGQQILRAGSQSGLVQAQGDSLPFQAESFSAIFCECVFSLFSDPRAGLREFLRVLEPGGYLALSDLYSQDAWTSEISSCAGRAIPFSETREMVESQGFAVCLVEDHTAYLKELAAKLVFAGDEDGQACGCRRRLGYYLMIAQKKGSQDV